jgi:anti-sigma B factor antagonist
MTPTQVTTHSAGSTVTVAVAGEVDLAYNDALLRAVLDAIAAPGANEVVVDLAEVTFLDSTGIGVLIAGRNAAHERTVSYRVTHASGMVRDVLDIAGVAHALLPAEEAGEGKDSDTYGFGV